MRPATSPLSTPHGSPSAPDRNRTSSAGPRVTAHPAPKGPEWSAFAQFSARVRERVDAELGAFVARRVVSARVHGGDVQAMVDALAALAMRGGKRLRPVLLAAAYEACGGEGGAERVVQAGLALELLQAYLLIHDDWMDDDDVRRGGPSVHAMLRIAFGSTRMGDSAAILAGDHASALAQEVLLSVPAPADRVLEAARLFARIQEDVVYGQLLDLRAGAGLDAATGRQDVEAMHDLKTGSYTVRGPVALGAILAGASADQRRALAAYAQPLGIAFQLRDDLLGTFGDAKSTGKPVGNDLRQGKRTALVAELAGDADAMRLLPRVLGVSDAPDAEVAALLERIVLSGAKRRVEARLDALLAGARAALQAAPIEAAARAILLGSVLALGDRES